MLGAAELMMEPTKIPTEAPAGIALFDLDGTLLAWDCQLLFRHHILREEPWRGVFLPVFLMFLPLAGLLGAGGMKRVFLSYLWKMTPQELSAHSIAFATSLMPAIYPELRERLDQQRRQGHFLILASASPEFYVREIGKELGFDLVLGTPVERSGFFPDLENHKGAAKVERLHECLPPTWFENGQLRQCHGYTDSTADLPMLALCQSATVVNPGARLTELAESHGWAIVRPARPWHNRLGFAMRALALLTGLGNDPAGLAVKSAASGRSRKNPA